MRHEHWHAHRARWGIRHYMRARMHRRIFAWFGVSILATGLVVVGAVWLTARSAVGVPTSQKVRAFAGHEFARVWNEPVERRRFASEVATTFDVDLTLRARDGSTLETIGGACVKPWVEAPVTSGDARLGEVLACGRESFSFKRIALPLVLAWFVLWALSGLLARRLTRPLWHLARVADELGRGRLSSRAHLGWGVAGEVGLLSRAFNEMAARLERQVADQRELLAGVSHELRTPLSRVRLLVELMRESGQTDRLDEVEREVVEMDALVGELLASARLDFSALEKRPLDATELARRALERAGESADKLVVEVENAQLQADPTLVARALANLVDNAKKHGGGVVALRVSSRDGALAFEVDDSGPGFPAEATDRVFRPFAPRVDGQPREPGSLGLGLSLVRRIAEAHGGRAYAANRSEGGGRVGFELPLAMSKAA